jgi:ribosomal protein L37AE/L43A
MLRQPDHNPTEPNNIRHTTKELLMDMDWRLCCVCGDDYPVERFNLGYRMCMPCGDDIAREERKSWTVVQEYGKGGYMFVTADSAPVTLKQTNQKQLRG